LTFLYTILKILLFINIFMIIIWIDPWTTTVWYAISKKEWKTISLVDYGIIKTIPKIDNSIKILEIWTDIKNLIERYKPDLACIEKLYFTNNIKTWISVSEARWVIIYEFMKNNIEIMEYTPLEVKKYITWNWAATKKQVQNAIKIFFKLDEIPKPDDAADAIAISYLGALSLRK
jgi:crossover junction endodeoxyribonuclease RuvC